MLTAITKQDIKNCPGTRVIPKGMAVQASSYFDEAGYYDITSADGTRICHVAEAYLQFCIPLEDSGKPQLFDYIFPDLEEGDYLVSLKHIRHALGNSDQYPEIPFQIITPNQHLQAQVLCAVIKAIEAVPVYEYHKRKEEV